MMKRLLIRLGLSRDPGPRWVDDVLAPLRETRADADVAASVMMRVHASESPGIVVIATGSRFPLVAALIGAPLLLGAIAALVASGDGFFDLWNTALALGHVAWVMVASVVEFCGNILSSSAPVARAVARVFETIAPILRGAGLIAAAWGVLSILFSFVVFAQARRNSSAGPHGGLR